MLMGFTSISEFERSLGCKRTKGSIDLKLKRNETMDVNGSAEDDDLLFRNI